MSEPCLGCGRPVTGACTSCEAAARNVLEVEKHWPLETSITPAALAHVEAALTRYLEREAPGASRAELENLENLIRSHLQHVVADRRAAAIDPLLE